MHQPYHEYILEIFGQQLESEWFRNNYSYPVFKQTEHHFSLKDAFESLMREDIRLFEKYSEETALARRVFSTAQIRHKDAEEPFALINVISFHESPDGSPTAGIYLSVEDREIHELEKKTGHDFMSFEEYDPDSTFLLLGRLVYDRGINVIPDPAWEQLHHSLLEKEKLNQHRDFDWKYCIYDTSEIITIPKSIHHQVFHYSDPTYAFQQFLNHSTNNIQLANHIQLPETYHTFSFHKRNGYTIAEVFQSADTSQDAPGIYLKIHIPAHEFQQLTNIDITPFPTETPNQFLLFSLLPEASNQSQPTIAWNEFTNANNKDLTVERKQSGHVRIIMPGSPGGLKR